MSKQQHLVAVYGTLRKSGRFHDENLSDSKFLGAEVISEHKMYDMGFYPAVIPCADRNTQIYVELYAVSQETLDHLDIVEGYHPDNTNNLFTRVVCKTMFGPAYIYVMGSEAVLKGELIPDGDYIAHLYNTGESNVQIQ